MEKTKKKKCVESEIKDECQEVFFLFCFVLEPGRKKKNETKENKTNKYINFMVINKFFL